MTPTPAPTTTPTPTPTATPTPTTSPTPTTTPTPPKPEPDPGPPCEGKCCDCGCSSGPVRYFNGEVQLAVTDLSAGGFGAPWEHRRVYSNRLSADADVGNGYDWLVESWPYLIQHADGSIAAVRGPRKTLWFDLVGGGYVGRYGAKSALVHDATNQRFELRMPTGEVWRFQDFDQATYPRGLFQGQVAAGGQVTQVTSYTPDGHVGEVQRTGTSGGSTTTESLLYAYQSGRVQSVTLRRQVNGGAWTEVDRVLYEYYASGESFGSLGDLKRARIQVPSSGVWGDSAISSYRYYSSGEANGFVHGLKYNVGPKAYAQMTADGLDPLAASNAQVALYADNYFEYDGSRRVTKETLNGGSRTFTFAYTTGANPAGYNNWKTKTVETRPGGSQDIVYTNSIGQILVKELRAGTQSWIEAHSYDSQAREVQVANPSAVLGYGEAAADLAVSLKAADGLIRVTNYYATTGSGAVAGYVQSEAIKRGSAGTPIMLRSFEYASATAGGVTVYPVSKEVVYRNEDGTGAVQTTYGYTWYAGTVRVQQKTTTLPAVPASQNGPGTSATRQEVFDQAGNLTWRMDERGFITRFAYDLPTGALAQRIDDVDTTKTPDEPAGWATPAGGGLHLVTDFEFDAMGRTTQELGPWHTIDLNGVATSVRRATWTVYRDIGGEEWTGSGYATGAAPNYTYTLINSVSITRRDPAGNVTDQIRAVRASTAGRLQPSDSFPQSSYVRWTSYQFTDCCLPASQRLYFAIPATGTGSAGTNYNQTSFGYDALKRRNQTTSPGGTITIDVLDARGRIVGTFVGTNAAGATDSDPTGGGAAGNNMVQIAAFEYDNGQAGGDGNLTTETRHVDAATTRVTTYLYDWRDRRIDTDGEVDFYEKLYYDNLDRVIKRERYNTASIGTLVGREEAMYDDRGRSYLTNHHAVDPATGAVGNMLSDNVWYDAAGNKIKRQPAGSKLFTKTAFDGLGREVARYVGFDLAEAAYVDAANVAGDTILEQAEMQYDATGNEVQSIHRERFHTAVASATGALTGPAGPAPQARATYVARWHDALGRRVAEADYGTNGGTALARPSTIPARSETVLVSSVVYDDSGEAFRTIDPAGVETRLAFDSAGRETQRIENYVNGDPTLGIPDQDRTTRTTYHPDDGIATLTAINTATGDQTMRYIYGTTLADSDIARSDLLRAEIYPDADDVPDPLGDGPDGVYDRIEHRYNRQLERKETMDQNGTVHAFDFDKLGRLTQDRVTALAAGVDGAVRRIGTTYEVRGMRVKLTSYDDATVGSGNIVNEAQFAYNNFGQLVSDYQSHRLAVDISATVSIQYGYADGSANTIRPTSLTYPSGRTINYAYGPAGEANDSASRVASIVDGITHLADYSYLGLGTFAVVDHAQPGLRYTLTDPSGGNDPDTGDIYTGIDRFGRVKSSRWYDVRTLADVELFQYGYDRAGNRTWRANTVAAAAGKSLDELFVYDHLDRLQTFQRGRLDAQRMSIVGAGYAASWTMDAIGNWGNFKEDRNGDGTWDLEQQRTANKSNEITSITNTVGTAWAATAYDRAGNMTSVPKPTEPITGYAASYDAWNRLVRLVEDANTVQENEYDGLRRRTLRKTYSAGVLAETRHFYYSHQWQVLEEQLGASAYPNRQFVWGIRYIDNIISRDRDTIGNGTLDERLYTLHDANWNVTSIVGSDGNVQERYGYQAYGQPLFFGPTYVDQDRSNFEWETLFAGYRRDEATALCVVRNRVYHGQLGVWLTVDPIRNFMYMNYYQYVENNPSRFTDPLGLQKAGEECACKDLLEQVIANDMMHGEKNSTRIKSCNINMFCDKSCGSGTGGNLTGMTFIRSGYIHICINCSNIFTMEQLINIIIHESVHAVQLLRTHRGLCHKKPYGGPKPTVPPLAGAGITDPIMKSRQCAICIKNEKEAYSAQCNYMYHDREKRNACINSGLCTSCGHVCQDIAKPCKSFPVQGGTISPVPGSHTPVPIPLIPSIKIPPLKMPHTIGEH